ncbi:hypothetical protein BC938DRAFT_482083 [Jimgerdemannia flammicorona]|uniref:Transcription and mRNA export factor SUS1 n=1 Tax=Jimgerdemannia flammicorona TaxID=994334 RepID=A0A433QEQ9_9FUNG|nr:hypothetical protein BC938DRAFT_482083 [Jimgerdemannia flammicorona]
MSAEHDHQKLKAAVNTMKTKGVENVTMTELVEETSDHARATVADNIKKELLGQLKIFLDENLKDE